MNIPSSNHEKFGVSCFWHKQRFAWTKKKKKKEFEMRNRQKLNKKSKSHSRGQQEYKH